MADTFVTTASGSLGDLVQTGWDRLMHFALRSQPQFDACYDVKPALQAIPGSTVTFSFYNDLAVATATLNESTDLDAVGLTETQTSVTLGERGNAVRLTSKLRATSFADVDEGAANILAYNVVDSLDTVARDPLTAGTNVIYSGGQASRPALTASHTISSANIRRAVAKLRGGNSPPSHMGMYIAYIHPDVSYDLRTEAGSNASWSESRVYAAPDAIFAGEIGAYQGCAFIETPRARIFADGGSGNVDAYATVICGQQAGAKAVAIEPHLVQSPVVDKLRRLPPFAWYALSGYARFREASLYRIESASAIGANT